jgi:hypothetical protein
LLFVAIASLGNPKREWFGLCVELTANFGLANTSGKGAPLPIISLSSTFMARDRLAWLVLSVVDLPTLKQLR